MTIDEALTKFLLQLQGDGRSTHTQRQYARHVRLFSRWCSDVAHCGDDIAGVDHEIVAKFLASP